MKIGVTINLGNYESLRVESSERERWQDAAEELFEALWRMRKEWGVAKFLEKALWSEVKARLLKETVAAEEKGEGEDEEEETDG